MLGGSFSWDNLAFTSNLNTSTSTQPLYASSIFQDSTFSTVYPGITNQTGNAQRIYFSFNSSVSLTYVWDPTITYTDVGSFATRLQFGMITILFAALMGLLL